VGGRVAGRVALWPVGNCDYIAKLQLKLSLAKIEDDLKKRKRKTTSIKRKKEDDLKKKKKKWKTT
jgi:hypothetical protein